MVSSPTFVPIIMNVASPWRPCVPPPDFYRRLCDLFRRIFSTARLRVLQMFWSGKESGNGCDRGRGRSWSSCGSLFSQALGEGGRERLNRKTGGTSTLWPAATSFCSGHGCKGSLDRSRQDRRGCVANHISGERTCFCSKHRFELKQYTYRKRWSQVNEVFPERWHTFRFSVF